MDPVLGGVSLEDPFWGKLSLEDGFWGKFSFNDVCDTERLGGFSVEDLM